MDFVVAGLGFGALIVVLGFVIRDIGPLLWKRLGHGARSNHDDDREQWRELCHSVAFILTIAGCAVLIVTVVDVLVGVTDRIGEISVAVFAVAAILAIVILVGLTVRDYLQSPVPVARGSSDLSRQTTLTSSPLMRSGTSDEVSSVRRVGKRVSNANLPTNNISVVSASSETVVETSGFDEPFDPTKLLASEFGEQYESEDAEPDGTQPEPETPEQVTPDEITAIPSGTVDTAVRADNDQEQSESASSSDESEAVTGAFRSRLLADIGALEPSHQTNGSFESKLFADVDSEELSEEATYQSPLLANLDSELEEEGGEEVVTADENEPIEAEAESASDAPVSNGSETESIPDESEEVEESESVDAKGPERAIQR